MAESSDILVSGLAGGGGSGGGGGISNVVEDLTPQLGGDLDLNGHVITGLVIGTNVQAYDAKLTDIAGKIRQSAVDTTFAIDFTEATNNGTNYTRLHGANGIGANVDIQLPDTSGFLVRYEDIGTLMQAYDADLTTLASSFTSASASGGASLAFHEDTDNGTNKVTIAAPASVASDVTVTLPTSAGTLALTSDITGSAPIKTLTASSSASLDFVDGVNGVVLDGTYDEYYIVLTNLQVSNNASNVSLRVTTDGGSTWKSSAGNYRTLEETFKTAVASDTATTTLRGGDNQTIVRIIEGQSSGAGHRASGLVQLYDPSDTAAMFMMSADVVYYHNDLELAYQETNAQYTAAGAVNGIRIFPSAGTLTSGTASLYGRKL